MMKNFAVKNNASLMQQAPEQSHYAVQKLNKATTQVQRKQLKQLPFRTKSLLQKKPSAIQSFNDPNNTKSKSIHQNAAAGVQGMGSRLPHLDTIQKSFGRFDVTHVQAYSGPAANAATKAMGAEAYATGNKIAFSKPTPSLHTAAHEAAHVIQQRAGVHLKEGVGRVNDEYEKHADAVADRVVQGKSAESLLNNNPLNGLAIQPMQQNQSWPQLQRTAAHIVQQHAGVHLKNGIGEVGDQYEKHADAVADLVVQGQSAENLLNKYSNDRSTNQSAVQMAKSHDGNPSARTRSEIWYTSSGSFSKRDTTTSKLDRAGEVEAVLLPTDGLKGTVPNTDILGWHWVHQFNGTDAANGSWVRFHILNENLGGSGTEPKNLVPTTNKTNHASNWHAKFEEPTKDALLKHAKAVHFYAKAEYYDNTKGSDPGEQHLEFFPKSIKAESSYWDSTSTSWKKIATDASAGQLDNIPPPPTNPAVVPIYLKTATKTQLDNNFKTIDADLRRLITTEDTLISKLIENLSAASTLQDIYDAILHGLSFDLVTRGRLERALWLNMRWDALEAALKASSIRPLRLMHGWVASGSVTKEKTEAQKEQERRKAEEKAAMAVEEAAKSKRQQESKQNTTAEYERLMAFGLPSASPAASPSVLPNSFGFGAFAVNNGNNLVFAERKNTGEDHSKKKNRSRSRSRDKISINAYVENLIREDRIELEKNVSKPNIGVYEKFLRDLAEHYSIQVKKGIKDFDDAIKSIKNKAAQQKEKIPRKVS